MTKINSGKKIVLAGWLLAVTALLGTGLMVIVNAHSKPFIAENERLVLLRTLNSVLSPDLYDNEIVSDTFSVVDAELLGSSNNTTIYRARLQSKPVAAVLQVIAPNGYSGPIVLLVGINLSGEVVGVRVVKHKETPGLGDGIEIQRSDWIKSFTGKSNKDPGDIGWKVKRDGGEFDQFTGATITPRAIVSAVHNALIYFEQHQAEIFASREMPAE